MKETPRAQQAFNDYLAMGDDRSLEKLLAVYQKGTENPPCQKLRTLKEWSRKYKWQERLAEQIERERAAIEAKGIVDRQNRVNELNERWQLMRQLRKARAKDALMAGVSGGETGLLVASPMLVKVYECGDEDSDTLTPTKQSQIAYEYAFDASLMKEMRDTEKQAAIEMGQWEEKTSLAGEVTMRRIIGVPDEAV